jgi:hypothetical protein
MVVITLAAVAAIGWGASDFLAYAAASHRGALSVVSAVSSLYPLSTIALGRLLRGTRARSPQLAGAVVALLGAGLLSSAVRWARARSRSRTAGSDVAGRLVDRGVARVQHAELRVRERAGQLPSPLPRTGAIVAAVDHDGGLADPSEVRGQVQVTLAGQDVVRGLLFDSPRPRQVLRPWSARRPPSARRNALSRAPPRARPPTGCRTTSPAGRLGQALSSRPELTGVPGLLLTLRQVIPCWS